MSPFDPATEGARHTAGELAWARARLRALIDGGVVGVLFGDVDGAIHECNEEFARIVGRPREDILAGRVRWDEITPEEDLVLDSRAIAEARATGRCRPYEKRYRRPDGTLVTCEVGYVLLEPDRRESAAFILDVSARVAAERALRASEEAARASEERLHEILRHAHAGTFEWELGDGFSWSPENYELFGLDPAAPLVQRTWMERVHPEDLPRIQAATNAHLSGEAPEYRCEFRVLHPARGTRWLLGVGRAERDAAGRTRFRGLNLDITDRKLAEEEAREADRRKTEFLGVLSHELRNPLAPIRNALAIVERTPPGSEPARRALEILRRQAEHLARLVDDLLDVSRITHGKIELQPARLDLRDVARRACDDARVGYDERGVHLEFAQPAEPVWADADAARVAQMIGNLLHNALKFTPPGGRVRVRIARAGAAAEVSVRDSGAGIAAEDLGRIFERFVQGGRARAGSHGGLGVGLSIVRELARLHGGDVRTASEGPGRGAEFVLSLPLAGPPAGAPAPRSAAAPAPGRSVVIVEDNVDAGATLADLLALDGHDVQHVTTGQAGLDAIAARRPDVLICDMGLPDLNGDEVIRRVRAAHGGDGPFAIALTGYAQPRDREAALRAGFDAHLAKPPELAELQALLRGAPRRR